MYYLLVVTATLLFSFQFVFNDGYQKENSTGLNQTIKLSLYTGIIGFVIMLIINSFKLRITVFSLVAATAYAIVCIIVNYCTIKVLSVSNLAVYSVYSMIGGIALPFCYGVLFGEELSISRIVCFLLIILSILLTVKKSENSKKILPYCFGVFFSNGMVGVISAFHQSQINLCVDSASFLMLTRIVTIVLCLGLILIKTKDIRLNVKSVLYCSGIAGFNSIGNLLLLIALLELPASVQYPMVTGGTIVLSVVIDLIRKADVSKKEVLAAIIAFVASCFMAF